MCLSRKCRWEEKCPVSSFCHLHPSSYIIARTTRGLVVSGEEKRLCRRTRSGGKSKGGSSWWMFAKLRPSKSSQMHVFRSAACANTDATPLWNIQLSHHVPNDSHLGSQLRTKGCFCPNMYGSKWLLFPRWQKHLSYVIPILQASAHFLLFL